MKDVGIAFIAAVIIINFVAAVMALYRWVTPHPLEDAAIEYGCAQYNPQTGDFEWLGVEE